MRSLEDVSYEDAPYPTKFILDVNHKCNYSCKLCLRNFMSDKDSAKGFDYFRAVVDRLPSANEISIGALGDPFILPDLEDMLNYLMIKKIKPVLTTNGSLMTEEKVRMLPYGTTIFVSIDGGDDDSYRSNRVGGNLNDVICNIQNAKAIRKDLVFVINCMLTSKNIFDLTSLVNIAKNLEVPLNLFKPIFFSKDLELEFNIFRTGVAGRDALASALEYANSKQVMVTFQSASMARQLICYRAFNQPIIAYNGNVYPCDYVYQNANDYSKWTSYNYEADVEIDQSAYCMGNITRSSFHSIWNSKKWRQLRRAIIAMAKGEQVSERSPFKHCESCFALCGRCL